MKTQNSTVEVINRETGTNRDPITGAPGAHPIDLGVGATGGTVARALIGAAVWA